MDVRDASLVYSLRKASYEKGQREKAQSSLCYHDFNF